MKRVPRVPVPLAEFEENIGKLSGMMRARGIVIGEGLTADELQAMGEEQVTATQEDATRGREWREQHRNFLVEQAARFGRFMKALEATRSLLRDDPLALQSLARLGSRTRRSRTAAAAPAATKVEGTAA